MIGRKRELAAVEAVLQRAREGGGGLVVVRGAAGIGKTTLLKEATAAAGAAVTVNVRGHEADLDLPYVALADGLRRHREQVAALEPHERIALESALSIAGAEPVETLAVHAALLALCSQLAEEAPLFVLVDDAHWLDESTREALLFLARRIEDAGIAIVVATRDPADPWTALRPAEIELGGLQLEETRAVLAGFGEFSEDVVERLHAATGGNPLALVTIPGGLTSAQRVGAEPLEEPLRPGGRLDETLLQLIERLTAGTAAALVVLAAATTDDTAEIAAALRARGLTLEQLEEAERAGLVVLEPGRAAFAHPLYRSAVYHGAAPDARRAAHRAFAELLQDGDDRARRALHLMEATVEPDEETAAALASVGVELTRRAAHPQAGLFLERAALLSPREEDRAARLVLASEALSQRGDAARAAALAEQAAGLASVPATRAAADAALGRALLITGPMERASELLARAAETISDDDPLEAARLLVDASDAAFSSGDDARGAELARRAGRLLRGTPAPERFAVLAHRAFVRVAEGDDRHVERLVALVQANLDATAGDARVAASIAPLLLFAERYRDAVEFCEQAAARARTEGRLAMLVDALRNLAQANVRLGRFTEAAPVAADALLLAEGAGQSAQAAGILADLAECAAWRGDEAAFEEYASRGVDLARTLDVRSPIAAYEQLRGLLALGTERLADAAGHFEQALSDVVEQYPDRLHPARAEVAEARIRLGDTEAAETHLAVFSEQAARAGLPSLLSVEARCRGLLAADGDVDMHFQRAIDLHPQFEDEAVKARNLLAYGMALRRAGRRIDARVQLRLAAEAFQRCGAWAWLRQANAELRTSGGAAFQPQPVPGEALTPQEYQVARLVATGATNREVAAALLLSVKTVEAHLSRVYRKLDVSGRRALAQRMNAPGPSV